jgi:hypothetical protein
MRSVCADILYSELFMKGNQVRFGPVTALQWAENDWNETDLKFQYKLWMHYFIEVLSVWDLLSRVHKTVYFWIRVLLL